MNKFLSTATVLLILSSLSGISCRSAADKQVEGVRTDTLQASDEEQNRRALELFQSIFDMLENSDRQAVLPQIVAVYNDIVENYPKAALAHESYWRLILIYLNDYTPPAFEKAEAVYGRFIVKYPNSQFRTEIEDTLATTYARHSRWESIIKLYTPIVKNYIEKGVLSNSRGMFMYAEAKMRTGDIEEAEKGYRIVMAFFPDSVDSRTSRIRLDEIRNIKSKQQ